jgi:curved DNA-binding protein CbpA
MTGDKFFEERFKEIQEAYETLSDPYEKGKYDSNYDYFLTDSKKQVKPIHAKKNQNMNHLNPTLKK